MKTAFGNNIFDRYGSREVSITAHECLHHNGLHEFSPHNYIETIPLHNNISKIIITNLNNWAFPFIRYEIEDLCEISDKKCDCGINYPMIKSISGRNVEVVISPSGKLIDGEFFTHLFYSVSGVKQFQVIQESKVDLLININKDRNFNEKESILFLKNAILNYGDPRFRLKFCYVNHIDPLSSGKMAFVISKVSGLN